MVNYANMISLKSLVILLLLTDLFCNRKPAYDIAGAGGALTVWLQQ